MNNQRERRTASGSPDRRAAAKYRLTALGFTIFAAVVVVAVALWPRLPNKRNSTDDNGATSVVAALPSHESQPTSGSTVPLNDDVLSNGTPSGQRLPVVPGLSEIVSDGITAKVDPSRDPGWHSESFGEAATAQLKALGKLLGRYPTFTASQLVEIVHADVECQTLRPVLDEVYRDGMLAVLRPIEPDGPTPSRGRDGFVTALERLRDPFETAADLRVAFKTVRVEMSPESATTVSHFHSSGTRPEGTVQQNGIWTCRWTLDPSPLLTSVAVHGFEEIVPTSQSLAGFNDCTGLVIGDSPAFKQQLVHGSQHWLSTLDIVFGFPFGNQGLAIADVNGDGLDDIYVNQSAGLPNRLFVRKADGTVIDASEKSGLNWLDDSAAALFVDLDNDGDQDAAIVLMDVLVIHENRGDGRFTLQQTFRTPSHLRSLSSADYDGDGDLDLFVCGYNLVASRVAEDVFTIPIPYHDANNGGPNLLVRNEGQFSFTDATNQVGLDANNSRFSYAAAWEDIDNDGDMDLYVANDYGRNNLYRNQDGHFVDIAAQAGVEDIGAGMSVSWGDYNRDGLMDLYVGNMFSSAGNRITHQSQFKSSVDESTRGQFRRHARGNSLFENRGEGRFRDVSVEAGVTMGRWAWSSLFVDINNDGWEDLCVANGFITTRDTGDL